MSREANRYALVWVDKEFLESEGMLRILDETGMIAAQDADWEKIVEAAENTGGFAISGLLVEAERGPGLWLASPEAGGIEILIPWGAVRCVVTAQEPPAKVVIGLSESKKALKLSKIT